MSALMVTLRRRSKRVICAGPLPISSSATVSSGTLPPPAAVLSIISVHPGRRAPAREIWVRIGMLRSSRLNLGSCVEVSPMVPTRTVVGNVGRGDAEVGGAARVGPDGISGRRRPRWRRRCRRRGWRACRAPPLRPRWSSAAGLSLTSTSWNVSPASPPPKRTRKPGIAASSGAQQPLELALGVVALRSGTSFTVRVPRALRRRRWSRSRPVARRRRSPRARRSLPCAASMIWRALSAARHGVLERRARRQLEVHRRLAAVGGRDEGCRKERRDRAGAMSSTAPESSASLRCARPQSTRRR